MALTRLQFSLQGGSGLAADRYVNTFYVQSPTTPSDIEGADLCQKVINFYVLPINGLLTPSAYMHSFGSQVGGLTDMLVKAYRMEDPEPRVPFAQQAAEMPNSQVPGLPAEVAVCLSYNAAQESGQSIARRRGRIFIGPLNNDAAQSNTTSGYNVIRPSGAFRTRLLAHAGRLAGDFVTMGMHWAVHSPTTGPVAAFNIVRASVDDAFDTQRRRGLAPTIRESVAIPT